jgi:glycosyltransferase 2 family protein
MIKKIKLWFGFFVSVYCAYLIFNNFDYQLMLDNWRILSYQYLLVIPFVFLISYAIRIYRWWFILRQSTNFLLGYFVCARYYLIGNFLNNFLPLRAGDIYRTISFANFCDVDKKFVLWTVALERLLDVLGLLVLLLLTTIWLPGGFNFFPDQFRIPLVVIFGALVALFFLLFFMPKLILAYLDRQQFSATFFYKIKLELQKLFLNTEHLLAKNIVFKLVWVSVLAWIFEAVIYGLVIHGLLIDVPVVAMFLSTVMSTLSTLIPSSPGYIGTFDYAASASIMIFGVPHQHALAYGVFVHFILWILVNISGAIAWFSQISIESKISR